MFCPRCATHLPAKASRCKSCNLNVEALGHALPTVNEPIETLRPAQQIPARMQRLKQQRHSWGLLLVLCSFLVGCLIPLSLGLFPNFSGLSALVIALAGLAGVILVLGIMLLLAAEGAILTFDEAPEFPGEELVVPTNPTSRMATANTFTLVDGGRSDTAHDESVPQPVRR